jgi:hypothetical protein
MVGVAHSSIGLNLSHPISGPSLERQARVSSTGQAIGHRASTAAESLKSVVLTEVPTSDEHTSTGSARLRAPVTMTFRAA